MVDDMRAVAGRAAGGVPVMDFKLHCLLHTCLAQHPTELQAAGGVPEGGHFIWSDVDVQPTAPLPLLRSVLQRLASEGAVDVWTQRELQHAGTNVGFMVLRKSSATRQLLQAVRNEMASTGGLDQNVLNKMILSRDNHGAVVRRLPATLWASSNAASAPPLDQLLLHHANFILRDGKKYIATDPHPKMQQLARVKSLVEEMDLDGWRTMVTEIAEDPGLAAYKARYFGSEILAAWSAIEGNANHSQLADAGDIKLKVL